MAKVCNEVIENLENNKISCSIFFDLAEAFDTVDHKILLRKLYSYGIRRELLNLLTSYLTNRKQCTIVNKVKLNWCDSTYVVPQGSTLSPFLLLMYINDLSQVSHIQIKIPLHYKTE